MQEIDTHNPAAGTAPDARDDDTARAASRDEASAGRSVDARRPAGGAFAIDPRSLAALRIGCGLVTLYDLAMRSTRLDFYTDTGVSPRALMLDGSSRIQSVYALAGSTAGVAALFVLHALFAVGMVIGYRTRLMTAACLVMTWSLINRNHMIMTGGDQ